MSPALVETNSQCVNNRERPPLCRPGVKGGACRTRQAPPASFPARFRQLCRRVLQVLGQAGSGLSCEEISGASIAPLISALPPTAAVTPHALRPMSSERRSGRGRVVEGVCRLVGHVRLRVGVSRITPRGWSSASPGVEPLDVAD